MKKPDGCLGCPMYGDGEGFVPDEIVPGAKVFILMQNPGKTEERTARPATGTTGEMMDEHFLPLAGLERGKDVSVGNVLKCRESVEGGGKSDSLPTGLHLDAAIQQCTRAHLSIPQDTQLVVVQGGTAASFANGGFIKITDWRGFLLERSVLGKPTYVVEHLASLLHDPKMWWVSELDWRKIPRILSGVWPLPVPHRSIVTDDFTEAQTAIKSLFDVQYLVCDTEYVGHKHVRYPGYLTILGLAGWGGNGNFVGGLQVDWRNANGGIKAYLAREIGKLVREKPIVFHNYAADMPILKKNLGIQYGDYKRVDDTMLAHAILFSELPHSLEFLSSIYSDYGRHKHLAGGDPLLYNWGDVCSTASLWRQLYKHLSTDTEAREVYKNQSRALILPTLHSMEEGIRLDRAFILRSNQRLEAQSKQATLMAEAYLGRPINLGSDDQVAFYAYKERGYTIQINRETKRPTVDNEAVGVLRNIAVPLTSDGSKLDFESAWERILLGADPVLEARILYQDTQHLLDAYIYGVLTSVCDANTERDRKKARKVAKEQGFTEEDICDTIYPSLSIHAQKNGRWSTTEPPLAQLPAELRPMLLPRPDQCFLGWDWKGIELRVLEAESRSIILKKAHTEGIDLHTWTVCMMFGLPMPPDLADPHYGAANGEWRVQVQWKGSGDPRRTFAKQARYEMNYGGTGVNAAAASTTLGLPANMVKGALGRLLTADTAYYTWRGAIERQVRSTRVVRTFCGRPRRLLSVGRDRSGRVSPKTVREALDFPMQGAVSDIFNLTVVELSTKYPFMHLAWSMHDSQYWEMPLSQLTPQLISEVKTIVEKEWNVRGYPIKFPADFKVTHDDGRVEKI